MLAELHIVNFALIEQLHIQFQSGFTVLTGETGAGKSLLIDAIALLGGGRGPLSRSDPVRARHSSKPHFTFLPRIRCSGNCGRWTCWASRLDLVTQADSLQIRTASSLCERRAQFLRVLEELGGTRRRTRPA